MPQKGSGRTVKSRQQMLMALELRATGASFLQIAKVLSVSKSRSWRIVMQALCELAEQCKETAERVRQLELYRLDRLRFALDPKRADPRVADTLIRISERVAKLHGLDPPQKVERSAPGQTQPVEPASDLSKLTLPELLELVRLQKKMAGEAPSLGM